MSRGSNERKCMLYIYAVYKLIKYIEVVFSVYASIVKNRLRCIELDKSLAKEGRVESVETKR